MGRMVTALLRPAMLNNPGWPDLSAILEPAVVLDDTGALPYLTHLCQTESQLTTTRAWGYFSGRYIQDPGFHPIPQRQMK